MSPESRKWLTRWQLGGYRSVVPLEMLLSLSDETMDHLVRRKGEPGRNKWKYGADKHGFGPGLVNVTSATRPMFGVHYFGPAWRRPYKAVVLAFPKIMPEREEWCDNVEGAIVVIKDWTEKYDVHFLRRKGVRR